ncbi:MAG: hypothetical protein ACXVNM_04290 [Bacteroidia bacterium]
MNKKLTKAEAEILANSDALRSEIGKLFILPPEVSEYKLEGVTVQRVYDSMIEYYVIVYLTNTSMGVPNSCPTDYFEFREKYRPKKVN